MKETAVDKDRHDKIRHAAGARADLAFNVFFLMGQRQVIANQILRFPVAGEMLDRLNEHFDYLTKQIEEVLGL